MIWGICRSFYPYFLPLVIYGIFLRIREKKWRRAETLLALVFVIHAALTLFQLVWGGGDVSRRYFLPGVPLLFGWAGYALSDLASRCSFLRLVPVCLLLLLADALRPSLEYLWKKGKKEEIFVIRTLSPVIRRDWQGQAAFYIPEIRQDEYRSPKRPLVQCDRYPLLGYASGGSCTTHHRAASLLPDYRIFVNTPVVQPYAEIEHVRYFDRIYRIGKRIR